MRNPIKGFIDRFKDATMSEMVEVYELATVIATQYNVTIEEVSEIIKNLTNNGYGTSTAKLCQNYNINTADAFRVLFEKGWIDARNKITEKGLLESNNIVDEIDVTTFKPVFQDRKGGLYWDTTHELFKEKWNEGIVKECEARWSTREFNSTLKASESPFGDTVQGILIGASTFTILNEQVLKDEG